MRKSVLVLSLALGVLAAGCEPPRLGRPGDSPGPAELASRHFITTDGLALPLRSWLPDAPAGAVPARAVPARAVPIGARPQAVVLALHGFNDYSGAFREVGPKLAAAGVAVYAYDQRGFGGAPGRGRWHGEDRLREDAAAAARRLRARWPDRPLYLLGLSMGGAVAMSALARYPDLAAGGILIGPAVRGRDAMPGWQRWSLDAWAAVAPWYPFTGEGLRIEPTDNRAELRRMARDPYIIKQTRADAIYGLVRLMTAAARSARRQTTPLLLLYGLKDDLVPKAPTLRALADLPETAPGRPPHRVAVYGDGRHMLLRDLKRDRAIADILAWIADPTAPLPSGADRDAVARLAAAAG